ncbi:hypothetical protein PQX77_001713 [Marasmius sp. AFHP31]|nr:hypothetical protein PQX77_001713 [Marasmius sp. AFHP31]
MFSNARNFTIGGRPNFSSVGRDQITYNNNNSRHIRDSYSENEDDEAGSMDYRPRDRRYDNAEHRQSSRRRPQPEMNRASEYPDQRSTHSSQQAYPTRRHQPDPYPPQSHQPPHEGYYERPSHSGHALNLPYEPEGYYSQNRRYDRSDPYASQRQARSPPPQEDGYHPQSHYFQQPPYGYQNPSPWQQQRSVSPPRPWSEVEPNGQYPRAPPSQYSHDPHPYSYRQDDQQSFPRPSPPPPSIATGFDEEYEQNDYPPRHPMTRASRDDPNGQQIPHIEAPTPRWASNNPFRNRTTAGVRTAPPSTTVTRSPPTNYPDHPWSGLASDRLSRPQANDVRHESIARNDEMGSESQQATSHTDPKMNQPENSAPRDHTSHGSTSSPSPPSPAKNQDASGVAQDDTDSANGLDSRSQEGDPIATQCYTNQNHHGDNFEQCTVGRTSRDTYIDNVEDSYNVENRLGLSAIIFPQSPIFATTEPHYISPLLTFSLPYFASTISSVCVIVLVSIVPHYVVLLSRSSHLISDS